ncbi:hypothetical protein FRB99_002434 [Tulasnella sp. 403]|nr:hypothetical protein FRB99_002434 [Tulasnella sp. 403]
MTPSRLLALLETPQTSPRKRIAGGSEPGTPTVALRLHSNRQHPTLEATGLNATKIELTVERALERDLATRGPKDATRNPNNSSNGVFLPKLFMRALPHHFPRKPLLPHLLTYRLKDLASPAASVYTNFPLVTRSTMANLPSFTKTASTRSRAITRSVPSTLLSLTSARARSPVYSPSRPMPPLSSHHTGKYLSTLNKVAKNNEDKRTILDAWAVDSDVKMMVGYLEDMMKELVKT